MTKTAFAVTLGAIWASIAIASPVAVQIRADHYGHSRSHEYRIADGSILIREVNLQDGKEISSYDAKLTGEAKANFEKAISELFRQTRSSTNKASMVRDGTRYTVRLKSGNEEKIIVNYETHGALLSGLFREMNKVIPSLWQLHNP